MSFPCETLSMAAGNRYWASDRKPRNAIAENTLKLIGQTIEIMDYCERNNIFYIVENPRARARWFIPKKTRYTVWYCQYGDKRAKPTDIWTNIKGFIPKTCSNKRKNSINDCHHNKAPRGSQTGTQGMCIEDKYHVPMLLIEDLINCYLENVID